MDSKPTFEGHLPCSSANEKPCLPCINLIKFEGQMEEETGQRSPSMLVQHRKLKTMVNQAHDPISRSLPLEIISLIFEFSISRLTSLDVDEVCLPDDFDHHSLLKLGAVCTAWRKVAWATPRLWTFIAIRLNASSFPTRGTVAQEWLKRSGSLPLYIFVLAKDKEDIPEASSMESFFPLIETINSLSNRWRVLHLELPIVLLQRFRPPEHAPILHTLRLSDIEDPLPATEENTTGESFTAINIAPLAVFINDVDFKSVKIQWERLTMVSIWTLSVNELIALFDIASGLVTCLVEHLDSSSVDPSTEEISTRTQLYSSIQNLRFGSTSVEGVKEIFKMIELPALQRLGVWAGHSDIPKILASFLERSKCTLDYFSISLLDTPWDEITSLLRTTSFKSLERLVFKDCTLLGEETLIFRDVARHCCWWEPGSEKKQPFLPNLRRLSFNFFVEHADNDNWGSLFVCLNNLVKKYEKHNAHHAFHLVTPLDPDDDDDRELEGPISDPEIDGPKLKTHQTLQKLDLSLYVETVLDVDYMRYMDERMISRYIDIMERGVSLDISADISVLDNSVEERIVDTVDVIYESIDKLGLPEEDMENFLSCITHDNHGRVNFGDGKYVLRDDVHGHKEKETRTTIQIFRLRSETSCDQTQIGPLTVVLQLDLDLDSIDSPIAVLCVLRPHNRTPLSSAASRNQSARRGGGRMTLISDILHGSETTTCTIAEGKPCRLCEQDIDLDTEVIEAKLRAINIEAETPSLQDVEERRRLFRSTLNGRHDRLSSVLPVEIVAEIFKATLTRKHMYGVMMDYIIDSPLYLGAVCRNWRRIAWSTPSLWNCMSVFLVRPENKHLEETVKEWLERSGQLPLTIQITSGKGVADAVDTSLFLPRTGIFGDFVSHINACSARWQVVSFTGPSTVTDFLKGSSDGTPNLQVLRLRTTDGPGHHFSLAQPSGPQSLAIVEHPDRLAWDSMNIVWDNLTNIFFSKVLVPLCVRAIKEMPRLRQCALLCDSEHGPEDDFWGSPVERFIHPNLEIFKFSTKRIWAFSVLQIFDHFIFPNLTKLSIISDFHAEGDIYVPLFVWERSIVPFMLKSSSKLRTLHLQTRCEYPSLVKVLKEARHLAHLVLTDNFSCNGFYNRFDFHSFLLHLAKNPSNSPQEDEGPPEFLGALKFLLVTGYIEVKKDGISAYEVILGACGRSLDFTNPPRHPVRLMLVFPDNYAEIMRTVEEKFISRVSQLMEAGAGLDIMDPDEQQCMVLL